jgi:hypothetical protein
MGGRGPQVRWRVVIPAMAGGGNFHDGMGLALPRARAQRGRGVSIAGNGRIQSCVKLHVMILRNLRSWTYWTQDPLGKGNNVLGSVKELQTQQSQTRRLGPVYNQDIGEVRRIPRLLRVLISGGGDQEEFTEKSAHPKPLENSGSLVNPDLITMNQEGKVGVAALKIRRADRKAAQESGEVKPSHQGNMQDQNVGWALEVYKGENSGKDAEAMEAEMLELNLDEEEAEIQSKVLAIAVFYSRKSYSPHVLFVDMLVAWGHSEACSSGQGWRLHFQARICE